MKAAADGIAGVKWPASLLERARERHGSGTLLQPDRCIPLSGRHSTLQQLFSVLLYTVLPLLSTHAPPVYSHASILCGFHVIRTLLRSHPANIDVSLYASLLVAL